MSCMFLGAKFKFSLRGGSQGGDARGIYIVRKGLVRGGAGT